MEWIEGLIALLAGLSWGSFVSVCMERWFIRFSEDETRERVLQEQPVSEVLMEHIRRGDLSPFSPTRSFCFACGHKLRWHEIVPVASYLFSFGKCRTCGVAYGIRSLWVELSHGVFFSVAILFLKLTPETILLAIDFSFLSLLGYCHSYPHLGSRLKMTGILLLVGNGLLFFNLF